ncbi:MAG: hypothetical protein GKR87_09975 [Kiritimatiellae bacterium]|nr:hypothetical protein [Kiritimatiellia bacterium]
MFDYNRFYEDLYKVVTHPDAEMDTELRVRKEIVDGREHRVVDMDFTVEERVPLHAVLTLKNTGTKATDELRGGLTLQHFNLTKHDDVLTLTIPVSVDLETVRSVVGSYYLPYDYGNGGAFSLYGGYTKLDTEDFVPGIDLHGEGGFVGLQGAYKLIDNDDHELHLIFRLLLFIYGEYNCCRREFGYTPRCDLSPYFLGS